MDSCGSQGGLKVNQQLTKNDAIGRQIMGCMTKRPAYSVVALHRKIFDASVQFSSFSCSFQEYLTK